MHTHNTSQTVQGMKLLWHNFLHPSVTIMLLGHNILNNAPI